MGGRFYMPKQLGIVCAVVLTAMANMPGDSGEKYVSDQHQR
jgi:hypothetical protein